MIASKDSSRNYEEAFLLKVFKVGKRILAAIALPKKIFYYESHKIFQEIEWDIEE